VGRLLERLTVGLHTLEALSRGTPPYPPFVETAEEVRFWLALGSAGKVCGSKNKDLRQRQGLLQQSLVRGGAGKARFVAGFLPPDEGGIQGGSSHRPWGVPNASVTRSSWGTRSPAGQAGRGPIPVSFAILVFLGPFAWSPDPVSRRNCRITANRSVK
jgi:hypothetical protein